MSLLETSFSAWLIFLSSVSVNTELVLNKPATDSEVKSFEEAIGYELPGELVELYKITNGQQDPYRVEAQQGDYAASLLGYYDFLSLSQALEAYRYQQEIRREFGASMDDEITVRDGDFVDAVVWQEGWLPIAGKSDGHIAVDLSPPRGGTYGQLIPIGTDEFERRVLATSLSEFFNVAANETPKTECALEYGVPDTSDAHVPEEYRTNTGNPYILYITAEWNHPFYRDNCAEQPHHEQPAYMVESNAAMARFRQSLASQGLAEDRVNKINGALGMELSSMMREREKGYSSLQLPDWLVPGGVIPQEYLNSEEFPQEHFPNGAIPLDFVRPPDEHFMYFDTLGHRLACAEAVGSIDPDDLTLDDYRLFHRHLMIEGIWNEEYYQWAEKVMHNLPRVQASGTPLGGVSFCHSSNGIFPGW